MPLPRIVDEAGLEGYMMSGHPACAGCGATISLRLVLKAAGRNTILVIPAGCTSIIAGVGGRPRSTSPSSI